MEWHPSNSAVAEVEDFGNVPPPEDEVMCTKCPHPMSMHRTKEANLRANVGSYSCHNAFCTCTEEKK